MELRVIQLHAFTILFKLIGKSMDTQVIDYANHAIGPYNQMEKTHPVQRLVDLAGSIELRSKLTDSPQASYYDVR